jgi:UDP-N-acetyl-D-galactosamine dehydrogenase
MIKICIIGLGYVGLPICLMSSSKFQTVGFDTNSTRIKNLKNKFDQNNEYKKKDFINKKILFTDKILDIKNCNFYIICVPTPVNQKNQPNLVPIKNSFNTISKVLKVNDIIILESTVYPGVTNKFTKILEKKNKLIHNKDFFIGYSPERINPGDKENSLENINKIIALNTTNKIVNNKVRSIYKNFCKKLIFTKYIKEAETAKAIENIQRDLNIAFFNEILMISDRLKLNFSEVIRLAKTKWNFMNFNPGLVGGHCLPVDPYYLSYIAQQNNFKSIVALAGRKTNNNMEEFIIKKFNQHIKFQNKKLKNLRVLVVGLTYKYGVSDMRNSLNYKIYNKIKGIVKKAYAYDPFCVENNFVLTKNSSNLFNFDVILFLSKGSLFQKLYRKIKIKKPQVIFDPFYYYTD